MEELKLSEILAVKLCHDLAGVTSAINNGAELLKEEESLHDESVNLIASSAEDAVSRIIYYRQAYGTVDTSSDASVSNIIGICDRFFVARKVKILWENNLELSIPSLAGRLLLNMVLVVADSLIYGGNVKIHLNYSEGELEIEGDGQSPKLDYENIKIIEEGLSLQDVNVKNIQPYMVYMQARQMNRAIKVEAEGRKVVLKLKS